MFVVCVCVVETMVLCVVCLMNVKIYVDLCVFKGILIVYFPC